MAFVLAVIGLVGAPVATVLAVWARRWSLRAPEGAGTRVPDVYDLAYLAGGPERAAVALIEALVRGQVASIDDSGKVTLAEDWAFGRNEVPEHAGLAAARSGGWNWDPAASPQDVLTPAGYKPMIQG
jgi:uncharacterized protein (TIGR04222 family)